jgi:hypothetical protein
MLRLVRQRVPFPASKCFHLHLQCLRELGSSPFQWSVPLSYPVETLTAPSEVDWWYAFVQINTELLTTSA